MAPSTSATPPTPPPDVRAAGTHAAQPSLVDRSVVLAFFLLTIGALWPTSVGGTILVPLAVAHTVLVTALFLWLGPVRGHLGSGLQVWLAAAIVAIVIGASALSPFREWALGAIVGYVGMAALFALDLRGLTPDRSLARMLLIASALFVTAGVAVVVAFTPVVSLLVQNFASGYPELVEFMTFSRKPVFTFGSHSVAGFFYFIAFYLNLETARARDSRAHALMAGAIAALGLFLTSVTALVLMSAALGLLLVRSGRQRRLLGALLGVAVCAGVYTLWGHFDDFTVVVQTLNTLGARESGLSGRYAGSGNLAANLRYLAEQPLRPVGLTFTPRLFYGDSGPIEYLTRGSVPLLAAVYLALTAFCFRSLRDRRHARELLVLIFLFELGFTVLSYHRFYYLFAFAVMYLNQLHGTSYAPSDAARGAVA